MQPFYELLRLGDHVGLRREVVVPDRHHLVAARLEQAPLQADDAALLPTDQALVEGDDQQSHPAIGNGLNLELSFQKSAGCRAPYLHVVAGWVLGILCT